MSEQTTCVATDCQRCGHWPLSLTARDGDGNVVGEEEMPMCDEHAFEALGWVVNDDGSVDYTLEGELDLATGLTAAYTRTPRGDGRDEIWVAGIGAVTSAPTLSRDELIGVVADLLGVERERTA